MNFTEVNFDTIGSNRIPDNKISVVHGKNSYVSINSLLSKAITKSGFTRVKVYEDREAKTMSLVFNNTGPLPIQPVNETSKVVRIQHKGLVKYICDFFSLPPMNRKDTLFISRDKSNVSDQLTFFIRKDSTFEVQL